MDSSTLKQYVTKQAALMVLRSVDELTELFVEEGILTSQAAHIFFDKTRSAKMKLPTILKENFCSLQCARSSIV